MNLFFILCTLLCVTSARAQIQHDTMALAACSDSVKEFMYGVDGEEHAYVDFVNKKGVRMLPTFAEVGDFQDLYQQGVSQQEICKSNLNIMLGMFINESVPQTPPQNLIYSRNKVQLGEQNILICHSVRFFPPPITVEWTKNGEDVTDSATFSQLYPNEDYSFNQFSHLSIIPQEGDIYTCTVQHSGLQFPDTKTWEVDVAIPSMGPSVFCGVGLALGLLGVAVGTFFLIKGNQCN